MSNSIYAMIKQYEKEENGNVITEYQDWFFRPNDFNAIYKKILMLSNGSEETAIDAADWCALASVGDIYDTDNGEIEIVEID